MSETLSNITEAQQTNTTENTLAQRLQRRAAESIVDVRHDLVANLIPITSLSGKVFVSATIIKKTKTE